MGGPASQDANRGLRDSQAQVSATGSRQLVGGLVKDDKPRNINAGDASLDAHCSEEDAYGGAV